MVKSLRIHVCLRVHANIHASHSLPLHYTALQHVTLHYKALQIHMDYVTFHGFHYITHYIS